MIAQITQMTQIYDIRQLTTILDSNSSVVCSLMSEVKKLNSKH